MILLFFSFQEKRFSECSAIEKFANCDCLMVLKSLPVGSVQGPKREMNKCGLKWMTLHHDNIQAHKAKGTASQLKWKIKELPHPPYFIAPSYFWLFNKIKQELHFNAEEQLEKTWKRSWRPLEPSISGSALIRDSHAWRSASIGLAILLRSHEYVMILELNEFYPINIL